MNHIKHVRKPAFTMYFQVMRLTNRKTIPICKYHHNLIHAGNYYGVLLKTVFKNFKKEDRNKKSRLTDKTEN